MARALIAVTGAQTDTELVPAPGAGFYIRVHAFQFTASAAATVSLSQGTDGATTRLFYGDFAANDCVGMSGGGHDSRKFVPVVTLAANTALNITNSAGNLKGVVYYEITGVAP